MTRKLIKNEVFQEFQKCTFVTIKSFCQTLIICFLFSPKINIYTYLVFPLYEVNSFKMQIIWMVNCFCNMRGRGLDWTPANILNGELSNNI